MQEAEEDMKKVATVTPKKEKPEMSKSPGSGEAMKKKRRSMRSAASSSKGCRRRLFSSSPKKRPRRQELKAIQDAPRGQDSDSEDNDLFNGTYALKDKKEPKPQGQLSEDRSQEEAEESEGREDGHPSGQDQQEEPQQGLVRPPQTDTTGGPGTPASSGSSLWRTTMDDKIDMVEVDLLSLLTEKCSKPLDSTLQFLPLAICTAHNLQVGLRAPARHPLLRRPSHAGRCSRCPGRDHRSPVNDKLKRAADCEISACSRA